jgi:uncharacterized alkaline shock family protein YloU
VSDGYVLREDVGSITIELSVLATIVHQAAESVDGAKVRRRRRDVDVRVDEGAARVELALAAPYGTVLPEVARGVQERVAAALEAMCGLSATVDVAVEELEGP